MIFITVKQKIEYMIQTLNVALDELNYNEEYTDKEKKAESSYFYHDNRCPNMTLIRENLKTVGRYAYMIEKDVPTQWNGKTIE